MASETDKDPRQVMIEEHTREVAELLRAAMPPGVGFALILFHFGAGGFLSYAGNAVRDDFARALRELLAQIEGGGGN
jgi:hypothetical protein